MTTRSGLHRRLTIGVLLYSVVVALAVAAHGYLVNERAEHLVWQSLLESELEHFTERRTSVPDYRWTDTDILKLYGPMSGAAIPPAFASLPAGVHDEVRTSDGLFVAIVRPGERGNDVLALDISGIERRERGLTLTMALSTALVVAVLVAITHFGVGWLVRPLTSMANAISSLAADRPGQRVQIEPSAPREAEIVATAVNAHLSRIDEFVERERAFINMASHELRTPIAVVSSSAEVALEATREDEAERHLTHILRTARDMERLVALLVALARDPARLRAAAEPIELAELVPAIVADHEFLAARKELSFAIEATCSRIAAPTQVARAAIGNLVRNAIENSDRGQIAVTVADGKVTIEDPGHGMSELEMSALYTRLARGGEISGGGGIGIELIARLCEHLDWKLDLSSSPGKGTRAILDFASCRTEVDSPTRF